MAGTSLQQVEIASSARVSRVLCESGFGCDFWSWATRLQCSGLGNEARQDVLREKESEIWDVGAFSSPKGGLPDFNPSVVGAFSLKVIWGSDAA